MSNTPNYDAKVKVILDGLTPGERTCALTGEKWMMTDEEIGWYIKFNVPPSKVHPVNRMKVIVSFATGFGWWWNKHAKTGKPVLSYVHPATGIKVLPDPEFFDTDNTDKGREYDLAAPIIEQIRSLQLEVPFTAWRSLIVPENSIALLSQGDENSYFVTACRSKNSFYAYSAVDMESSAEVFESQFVINSYNILNSSNINNCKFVRQSVRCLQSAFIFDCRDCEFVFGGSNLRNKKYVFFNEQLSKEDWEARVAAIDLGSRQVLEEYFAKFKELVGHKAIWPENFNEQVEDCVGEYLTSADAVSTSLPVTIRRITITARCSSATARTTLLSAALLERSITSVRTRRSNRATASTCTPAMNRRTWSIACSATTARTASGASGLIARNSASSTSSTPRKNIGSAWMN